MVVSSGRPVDHPLSIGSGVVTPEAVVLDLETAGVGSRLLAGAIDLSLQFAILVVTSMVFAGLLGEDSSSYRTAVAVILAAVVIGYPVLFELWLRGRTPGKRVFGLRAVTVEGAPLRLRHVVLRMMGGLVDRWLPPIGVTGTLFVLATRRHQRIGDLLAGTIVVRDPVRRAPPQAVWFSVPPGLDWLAATIDPTPMTDEQYTLVRSFLMRNRTLTPEARYSVAERLATELAVVLRHPGHGAVHPEAFLLCVISRYQRARFVALSP